MDMNEVRHLKEDAEAKITSILKDFEDKSEVTVINIYINRDIKGDKTIISDVQIGAVI